MKIKSIFIVFILIILGVIFRNQVKDTTYKALVYFDIMNPCYRADRDFLEVFRQEGFDYLTLDKKVTEAGLKKLANRDVKADQLKIPTISHHIYFTSNNHPSKLNTYYIEKMKASFQKLTAIDPNWQHYIWTNKPEIFPEDLLQMTNVKIKSIDEFKDHELYPYLIDYIDKGNDLTPYFVGASDMTRLLALQKFGGMYNDIDYEVFNPAALLQLMKEFDFLGGREITKEQSYYGNSFIVAKTKHPIIEEALRRMLLNKVQRTLDYIKYPCSEHALMYANGPPLLTMSYFVKNNIDGNNDIILPTWMIMNATFARYKNIDCNYNAVTKELFKQREANIPNLLASYPLNTKEEGIYDSNIYYSIRDRKMYDIIGADMFCGGWSGKAIKKRIYYWKWRGND